MSQYIWLSALGSIVLLVAVLWLIRTRQLHERFALIWLAATVAIAVLTVWPAALEWLAGLLGIASPPNALFIVLGVFFLWGLLHASVAITRLARQNVRLAQRVAILEAQLREAVVDEKTTPEHEPAAAGD